MTESDIRPLRRWFKEYVQSFYSTDADIHAHVRLKEEHTARVCERMTELSGALRLDDEQAAVAEVVALFHDVGRFQQYTQYRTFNDFRSQDHACLGVRILRQTGVLSTLPQSQQQLVQKAVRYHNGRAIPADSDETVYLAKMIRDADKIDILAMITSDDAPLRILPSPEFGGMAQVSPGTVEYILQGQVARFEHIRTAADQMLFRMSWLLDMNFAWTFQTVREQSYLEKMAEQLPPTDSVRRVVEYLAEYRDLRSGEAS